MIRKPQFLQSLMAMPTYMDTNSHEYTMVQQYLKMLYPGELYEDATGRMISPGYDMRLKQFSEAQSELDTRLAQEVANYTCQRERIQNT